jgi:hypothetical protein
MGLNASPKQLLYPILEAFRAGSEKTQAPILKRSGPWGPLPVCELVGRLFCYTAKRIRQHQQSVRNSKSITPAEGATSKRELGRACRINWSGQRGSNPRPQAWEACALPTELCPLIPPVRLPGTCPENSKTMPEAKVVLKLANPPVMSSKINLRSTARGMRRTVKILIGPFLCFPCTSNRAPCTVFTLLDRKDRGT